MNERKSSAAVATTTMPEPPAHLLALLALVLAAQAVTGAGDGAGGIVHVETVPRLEEPVALGSTSCPNDCVCKWKGGKPTVECVNASLLSVPLGLDGDTQVLDLSLNSLPRLEQGLFLDRAGLPNLQKVFLAGCGVEVVEDHCFR